MVVIKGWRLDQIGRYAGFNCMYTCVMFTPKTPTLGPGNGMPGIAARSPTLSLLTPKGTLAL